MKKTYTRNKFIEIILPVLITFFMLFNQCFASLEFCNRSTSKVSVSIGYKSGSTWVSEGWWTIMPGQCKTVKTGSSTSKYYYYLATSSDGGEWSGDYYFCTDSDAFTIYGDDNCSGRGYKKRGFKQIYSTSTNCTRNLTESKENKDIYYRGLILGSWKEIQNENGVRAEITSTYTEDGRFTIQGTIALNGDSYPIIGSGYWKIRDGYLVETLSTSNISNLIPNGFTQTLTITNMTTKKFTYYDPSSQETSTAYYKK